MEFIKTSITEADRVAGRLFRFNPLSGRVIDSFMSYSVFYNSRAGRSFFAINNLTLSDFIRDVNIYPENPTPSYGYFWRRFPIAPNQITSLNQFDKLMQEKYKAHPFFSSKETSMHSYRRGSK